MDLARAFSDLPIVVLGGGVAGLAVATALARHGAPVRLFEQAPEITEVGAGLQISPNGVAVLEALGLGVAVAAAGQRGELVQLRDGISGARVLQLDLRRAGHARGYYFLHRADLIALLEAGARDAGVEISLGQRCTRLDQQADHTELKFDQGTPAQARLVIGADGLHSRLRRMLNPSAEPFFTGQVAWRAVIPGTPGDPAEAEVFMGPGRHLVSYPLRGGALRNIVAVEERNAWADEGWNHRDDPRVLRHAFSGFAPRVRDWLAQADEVWLWGLFRHPVAERWHGTHYAILGDAAHPTLPFLAQGANMALEDAWVLAAALAQASDLPAALAQYQRLRAARTRRIVAAANRNARLYHLRGLSRVLAHAALRAGGRIAPKAPLRRFDWLYGHDVTAPSDRGVGGER